MDNRVNVVIGGEIITLKSDEQPDYLQRLARYVDQKMGEVLSKSIPAAIDDRARTILVALNIANDYFKTVEKFERLDAVHKRFVQEMSRMQEENVALSENMKELREELAKARAELDEFLSSFDASKTENGKVLTMPKPEPRKAAAR